MLSACWLTQCHGESHEAVATHQFLKDYIVCLSVQPLVLIPSMLVGMAPGLFVIAPTIASIVSILVLLKSIFVLI